MTIGLQGTWIVSVKTKSAAWAQQFTIEGSTNGADQTYEGKESLPEFLVDGEQWGITIENDPTGAISWRPSRCRLANFRTELGFFKADIESDDGGGGPDEDFNDLVLTISKPLNASEWIVYGTAKSYKGWCKFNPCAPYPWVVMMSKSFSGSATEATAVISLPFFLSTSNFRFPSGSSIFRRLNGFPFRLSILSSRVLNSLFRLER